MSAVGMCASAKPGPDASGTLRVRCEINGSGRECRILELNSRRAFVESYVPAVTGSRIRMNFHLPNGHLVYASGVVTHHQFKVGFGVDFTEMSNPDRDQIDSFLGI
ncbi:MAG TPA: hypothetical protein VLD57_02590 [Blastocatellia bacterium]|nr:hypothetical protein [Blastocatellia bacterium]